MKINPWLRYLVYGIILSVFMYCIYRVVDSFRVEYTEPEIVTPAD